MDEKKYEVGKKKTLSFADGKKLTSLILNTILNVKHDSWVFTMLPAYEYVY